MSLLTPEPLPVPAVMTATILTRSRSLAPVRRRGARRSAKKMRALFVIIAILSSLSAARADEAPSEFARRFYVAHQTWPIRGVPTSEDEGLVSEFFGIEIIRAFRRVNEHQKLAAERYVPPVNLMKQAWAHEGEVFCDNWEGFTHFSIGKSRIEEGSWIVEAHLEYVERGESYRWTDVLVFDRAAEKWVISDIRYSRGGTLLTSILEGLETAGREIPTTAAAQKSKTGEHDGGLKGLQP